MCIFKGFLCLRMRKLNAECQIPADAHDWCQIVFSLNVPKFIQKYWTTKTLSQFFGWSVRTLAQYITYTYLLLPNRSILTENTGCITKNNVSCCSPFTSCNRNWLHWMSFYVHLFNSVQKSVRRHRRGSFAFCLELVFRSIALQTCRWYPNCFLVKLTPFGSIYQSLNRLPIWNSQNCNMFSSCFRCKVITGSLMRIKYLKLRSMAHLLSLECVHCS